MMPAAGCRCRILLPFLLFFLLVATAALAGEVAGKVEWVYDGDTLRVAGLGKVRLLGIDTPEKEDSERDRFYQRQGISPRQLRQVAGEVRRFNVAAVKGKTVRLTFDHERRDAYGRLLAYVHLPDGRLLNRLLLEKGYASVYRRADFRLKNDFLTAEAAAKKRKQGLWK